ncbi:Predicted amidohydrolase [Catalinimonas alkaloidigena]|uniref:Omega-amidase YafV n=1 Tax=Catalinimonas alkaloidigena TaxID=1075417 RepID=A0A1G9DYX2_9BACT|nr:amidohydrolase [Catalinimonas alkaloidigena]SDK69064.1 Predicted amidohydrolase [Catalinimonas alkaloidigena]
MASPLRVTWVQADLYWEDPVANRAMLEEMLWEHHQPTDLIVLPEMFTTGFSMRAEALAEPMNLTTFRWMWQIAAQADAAVAGSYIVREGEHYFNRLLWMEPDGQFAVYDKKHLFRLGGEVEAYTPGSERLIRSWRGWNICPLICYDLRFPVWCRNVENAYDLLIFVASWPSPRHQAWEILLQARAIENLCYTVGVNRTGSDGAGLTYAGGSGVIDYQGNYLSKALARNQVETISLSYDELTRFRQRLPFFKDADAFTLR